VLREGALKDFARFGEPEEELRKEVLVLVWYGRQGKPLREVEEATQLTEVVIERGSNADGKLNRLSPKSFQYCLSKDGI
jgi:hypothetical protein